MIRVKSGWTMFHGVGLGSSLENKIDMFRKLGEHTEF